MGIKCNILAMECTIVVEGREIGSFDCPRPVLDLIDEKYCCGDGATTSCCTLNEWINENPGVFSGILIGGLAGVAAVVLACYCLYRRRR